MQPREPSEPLIMARQLFSVEYAAILPHTFAISQLFLRRFIKKFAVFAIFLRFSSIFYNFRHCRCCEINVTLEKPFR